MTTLPPPEATPLAERMAKFTAGQITWPEPKLGRTCDQCEYFSRNGIKTEGKGRCWLVRAHQRVDGLAFKGADAVACPKFRALTP